MHGTRNGKKHQRQAPSYRAYTFVNGKDPVIGKIRTIIDKEHVENKDVATISGVSKSTLHNWFDGKTRRPQYATIAAVVASLGYSQKFVKAKQVDFAREVEKAAAEIKAKETQK